MINKKQIKICPIDNRPCDIKILPHDTGEWVSGKCRKGGFSEEDATFPECEKHLHNRRFNLEDDDDRTDIGHDADKSSRPEYRKKKTLSKPKRKVIKKCKCK
jgi:hypothetical protein